MNPLRRRDRDERRAVIALGLDPDDPVVWERLHALNQRCALTGEECLPVAVLSDPALRDVLNTDPIVGRTN